MNFGVKSPYVKSKRLIMALAGYTPPLFFPTQVEERARAMRLADSAACMAKEMKKIEAKKMKEIEAKKMKANERWWRTDMDWRKEVERRYAFMKSIAKNENKAREDRKKRVMEKANLKLRKLMQPPPPRKPKKTNFGTRKTKGDAKKAMKLMWKEGITLKQAWKRVKGKDKKSKKEAMSSKKKKAVANAKKAMRMHHREGITLKQAWKRVNRRLR